MQVGEQLVVGVEALRALQTIILDEWAGPIPAFGDRPVARLVAAIRALRQDSGPVPSPLDLAVLVRHVLRWCTESAEMEGAVPELLVPRAAEWPDRERWARVGVRADVRQNAYRITAVPWTPDWLPDVPPEGVDGRAAGARERRFHHPVPADPFVTDAFPERKTYRSRGQRTAVRAALMTPPGSTLLVGLPTGDGKSLIFQVLAKVGFPLQPEPGLVVVVTPTVSLALDHQATARQLNLADGPLAYQGGERETNQEILERVSAGTQRILFTSPEAISMGPLGGALTRAAESGYLSALVVDEAHLIETWGKEFRPHFQILAGIRTSLLKAARGTPFRTILLSATITEQTVETVRNLFGRGPDGREAFGLFAATALRPEIEYWVKPLLLPDVRERYVFEALYHLPRPAILYVTAIADANKWLSACRNAGFRRVAVMTGDTPPEERERIVQAWKADELDLVVGNAAFGLGIDKPDVRTVIHACVPESLDRFYQEVGRGGRDGRASLSLLLPTQDDVQTARSMQAKHIGIEKGYQRWKAMFLHETRRYEPESGTHLLWLDTPPGGGANRLDFDGRGNRLWNMNTLTLMAAAGLIELHAVLNTPIDAHGHIIDNDQQEPAGYRMFQRIRLLGSSVLSEAEWDAAVQPVRLRSYQAQMQSLEAMIALIETPECWSSLFAPVYTLLSCGVAAARNCGGCPACRKRAQRREESVRESPWPWPGSPIAGIGADLVDEQNRVLICYGTADIPETARQRERLLKPIAQALRRSRIHNVIIPQESPFTPAMLQQWCESWPIFAADELLIPRLPPGPAFVFLPRDARANDRLMQPREPTEARLVLAHEDLPDPHVAGARLRDRHNGRILTLEQFKRQVGQ